MAYVVGTNEPVIYAFPYHGRGEGVGWVRVLIMWMVSRVRPSCALAAKGADLSVGFDKHLSTILPSVCLGVHCGGSS